jgi:hypothetical protein
MLLRTGVRFPPPPLFVIKARDVTIAELLKARGYKTG